MSNRSNDRTEARRRARMAARGELPAEAARPEQPAPSAEPGGFLRKMFPPAPPLPGRPDPLKGFTGDGPLRPVAVRIHLLRQNLLVWIGFGLVAFLGFIASRFYLGSPLELIGTFGLFGALIGAGWFGWQRPTLYGTAAGVLGYVLATLFVVYVFATLGAPPDTFGTPATFLSQIALQGVYMAGLGFLGGWYGGYLRRRQAQLSAEARRRR